MLPNPPGAVPLVSPHVAPGHQEDLASLGRIGEEQGGRGSGEDGPHAPTLTA